MTWCRVRAKLWGRFCKILFRNHNSKYHIASIINMPHNLFRNKTFVFVKIESWNFQHLIDLGFHEIYLSQTCNQRSNMTWCRVCAKCWGRFWKILFRNHNYKIPYSRKLKRVLLYRKSKILLFKVSIIIVRQSWIWMKKCSLTPPPRTWG